MARQRKAEPGLWVIWKMFSVVPRPVFALWVLLSKSQDGVRMGVSVREGREGRIGEKGGVGSEKVGGFGVFPEVL